MGIKGLMKLIGDYAPSSMKESDIKSYFGKVFFFWRLKSPMASKGYNYLLWRRSFFFCRT